jgi:iron complex outermembrane recepter protein
MSSLPTMRIGRRALAGAVSAAVAGTMTPVAFAQQGIEEVIVSARKRDENIQDIPQAVLSFSAKDMSKKGIQSLQDVARFSPSMTVVGAGAGQMKVVFRGLADSPRPFIAESSAAIYLDEQPLTSGALSPEIRPVDLARIESLAGPQGTLYGASSQSGTVRYIVNKPDAEAFEASIGGGLEQIDSGGMGWDGDVMVNIPLIKDKLAIRLVGFGAKDAGYIDNVLGTTPLHGGKDNSALVAKDINEGNWQGGRISAKWWVNEDWSLTGIYNNAHSKQTGFNDYDANVGDLKTVKFVNERWDDAWSNYQFTVDGDLGWATVTSSTSYFERDVAYVFDASKNIAYYHAVLGVYGRGNCASDQPYYNLYDFATACELNGVGTDVDDADPISWFRQDQKDNRWTHETRFGGSTSKLDWTLGFFYQKSEQHWEYGTYVKDFTRTERWAHFQALREANGQDPLAPTDANWRSGERWERKDASVFGEGEYALNEQWKIFFGARWYKADIERLYYERVPSTNDPRWVPSDGSENGWLPKIGLKYQIDDDRMVYALYSEGFRLGGANRDRAEQRGLVPTFPREYESDILQNWELGLKSQWFEGQVQLNITGYHQVWKDMQLELNDPGCCTPVDTDNDGNTDVRYPYQTVIANLGDAQVDGFDVDLSWSTGEGWSAGIVSTYLFKAELKDDIIAGNPNDPTDDPFVLDGGTRLPLTADLKFSTYLEYAWPMALLDGGEAYARLQYSYTDGSWNRLKDNDSCPGIHCFDYNGDRYKDKNGYGARGRQPDYETVDLRMGYSTDLWDLTLYADNMLDQRVVQLQPFNAATYFGGDTIRTSQPRSFGMSVRRSFH